MTTKCILDGRMSIYSICVWFLSSHLSFSSDIDMCFVLLFVTSHVWYLSLTFGIRATIAFALSMYNFRYFSNLISLLMFRASFVKKKIRNLYFGWFPCFLDFELCKTVPKWVRTEQVCIWVGLTRQRLKMMNNEFLFVLKKENGPFMCWLDLELATCNLLDIARVTRLFKVLWYLFVFLYLIYAYTFLFTFAICAILIYFMHEYIL